MLGDVLPVFGGGFLVAFRQLSLFYYGVCFALHTLVPWLTQPRPLQQQPRKRNDVMRDAFYSIGPLAVKAGYWKLIEELHAHDYGLMYDTEVR
jgi:hypothetical protein